MRAPVETNDAQLACSAAGGAHSFVTLAAVNIQIFDVMLVPAREGNKLFGVVYASTSSMALASCNLYLQLSACFCSIQPVFSAFS